jgi:hypothetical protein
MIERDFKRTRTSPPPTWHMLQISDVLDLEFAVALAESVPLIAWEPERTYLPPFLHHHTEDERVYNSSSLRIHKLPLLHGFARFPLSAVAGTGPSVVQRLLRRTATPELSPLICTVPYFASAAKRWPGPVVYWLTDLIAEYESADRSQVIRLDRRMCNAATLICPNSERIKQYLIENAACDPAKIHVVPNATRVVNILPSLSHQPTELPELVSIKRPIAGIIGNLAGNMDWLFLHRLIELTPYLTWVFVGPTTMPIANQRERQERDAVIRHRNTHFIGKQPYGALASYARAFDVAVLPYKRCEPTYSGSSTRFYEHLAACRPMLATRGLEELTRKEPLLSLVDTAEQAADVLHHLHSTGFKDGLFEMRWRASQTATWQTRANSVREALAQRLSLNRSAARAPMSSADACLHRPATR